MIVQRIGLFQQYQLVIEHKEELKQTQKGIRELIEATDEFNI